MKELIEKIIKYIPEYLMTLGKLLSRPKTFLAGTAPETEAGFQSGLQFLAVSVVLVVIALTPLAPEGTDIWKRLAAISVAELLGVAAMAGVLRVAWRVVGGRAGTRSIFTVYSYVASVVLLLVAIVGLISDGTVKVFDPALYAALRQAQVAQQPVPAEVATSLVKVLIASAVGLFLIVSFWGFATWGAFRALNGTSRGRSVAALVSAGMLAWPVTFVLFLIGRAMSP